MAEYDRWYIVPISKTEEDGETFIQPKYSDDDGIEGYSGTVIEPIVLEDSYPALLDIYPDVEAWYLVRLYGTWSALNDISVLGDTRNLASNPGDVEAVLNQRFPNLSRTAEEWGESFSVSSGGE